MLFLLQAAGKSSTSGPILWMLIPFVLMFVVMYFLILRPQKKKEKVHKTMLANIRKSDSVVTVDGIHGSVVSVRENEVILRVDDTNDVKVKVNKSAITKVRQFCHDDTEDTEETAKEITKENKETMVTKTDADVRIKQGESYEKKFVSQKEKVRTVSNMGKYTNVSFVETTKEKTEVAISASLKCSVVMTPGVFPVCAVCGKDCQTLANDKYAIQVGTKESSDTPMLCRACKSVVCQQCAGVTKKSSLVCSKCGSTDGFDLLLPFVFCDKCGKRAALISGAVQGEATYMLLDKGAVPLRCTECQSISCADCLSKNNTCQKCGSSKLDLFVPGYTGTGVIIAKIDPSGGHITLAVPG